MKKFWILEIAFWLTLPGIFGATRFDLPAGTPGLEPNDTQVVTTPVRGHVRCKHVTVPGTVCNLYFPVDGSQPDTKYAGIWSGARYNGSTEENDRVTDWWIRAFGGFRAVSLANNYPLIPPQDTPKPIIWVDLLTLLDEHLERQFWETFRTIASNPVGRVLLYRLLIEIRRVDSVTGEGCCGENILLFPNISDNFVPSRNVYRSIKVEAGEISAFDPSTGSISFKYSVTTPITVSTTGPDGLKNQSYTHETDIELFREMLPWFLALVNPGKKWIPSTGTAHF